ncbi:hypothetical protein HB763_18010 [Vibrio campbellii]|nr:hypothetical protein HB763_18010 [Vibrio campbellii]
MLRSLVLNHHHLFVFMLVMMVVMPVMVSVFVVMFWMCSDFSAKHPQRKHHPNDRERNRFDTRLSFTLYPSNLEMLGSARMTWFVDAAAI